MNKKNRFKVVVASFIILVFSVSLFSIKGTKKSIISDEIDKFTSESNGYWNLKQNIGSNLLVADSGLQFSTYIGTIDYDKINAVAVDDFGYIYITGKTGGEDFPITSSSASVTIPEHGSAIFVCKIHPNGTKFEYSILLEDTDNTTPTAIVIDNLGCAYIASYSLYGTNIRKINVDGSNLEYSVKLGNSYGDRLNGMVLDSSGCAYIIGDTVGFSNITSEAYDEVHNGGSDVFVSKLSFDGTELEYSTFIGGSSNDYGKSIAIDSAGNAYVTGYTNSIDFPTTAGVISETINGGDDIFVCKLNPEGTALDYSTFIGGSSEDWAYDIALNSENCPYITGAVRSYDFPCTSGIFERYTGQQDVIVLKINEDASSLEFSNFLGGSSNDVGKQIKLDNSENIIVAGVSHPSDIIFPTTSNAINTTYNGANNYGTFDDIFICNISSNGSKLFHSTLFGGSMDEIQNSLEIDKLGNIFIVGSTQSVNFPTTSGVISENFNSGFTDGYLSKFNFPNYSSELDKKPIFIPSYPLELFFLSGIIIISYTAKKWKNL